MRLRDKLLFYSINLIRYFGILISFDSLLVLEIKHLTITKKQKSLSRNILTVKKITARKPNIIQQNTNL